MMLSPSNALIDPDYTGTCEPYDELLDITVQGKHVYGEIYVPGGVYSGKRPTVLLFHGIPGMTVNDDIAQALRRIGCLVIRVFHRGAWGSEGYYSFSNCIEDGRTLLEVIQSKQFEQYPIDFENVFIVGHSNGGNTSFQISKSEKWVRGLVMIAPFNHNSIWSKGEECVKAFCEHEGKILHKKSEDALVEDSRSHYKEWDFAQNVEKVSDLNILLIEGTKDEEACEADNVSDFWKALEQIPTSENHTFMRLEAGHCFSSQRIKLIEIIVSWISEIVD